jgi:hypothetical protein
MIWYFNVQNHHRDEQMAHSFLNNKKVNAVSIWSRGGCFGGWSDHMKERSRFTRRNISSCRTLIGMNPLELQKLVLSSLPWCASRGQPQSHVTPLTLADEVPRFPCLADVQQLPDKTDYRIQHDSIEYQLHLNPLEQRQLDSTSDKWFDRA